MQCYILCINDTDIKTEVKWLWNNYAWIELTDAKELAYLFSKIFLQAPDELQDELHASRGRCDCHVVSISYT